MIKQFHVRQEEEDNICVKSPVEAGVGGAWQASPKGVVGDGCC